MDNLSLKVIYYWDCFSLIGFHKIGHYKGVISFCLFLCAQQLCPECFPTATFTKAVIRLNAHTAAATRLWRLRPFFHPIVMPSAEQTNAVHTARFAPAAHKPSTRMCFSNHGYNKSGAYTSKSIYSVCRARGSPSFRVHRDSPAYMNFYPNYACT